MGDVTEKSKLNAQYCEYSILVLIFIYSFISLELGSTSSHLTDYSKRKQKKLRRSDRKNEESADE